MKPKTKYKILAEERVAKLWKIYETNGRLTMGDVQRTLEKPWFGIYEAFKTHGIEGPPVWDSQKEIRRRQAEKLCELAAAKENECLTEKEAADCLGMTMKYFRQIEGKLEPFGLPLIKGKKIKIPDKIKITPGEGLQVLCWYPGPEEDQITYVLR